MVWLLAHSWTGGESLSSLGPYCSEACSFLSLRGSRIILIFSLSFKDTCISHSPIQPPHSCLRKTTWNICFYFTHKKGKKSMTCNSHLLQTRGIQNKKEIQAVLMREKFGFTKLKNQLQSLHCINIVSLIFNVESDQKKQKKLCWCKKSPGPWIHHNVCLFSQPNQVMPTWWELLVSSRTLGSQMGYKYFVTGAHTPSPSSKPLLPCLRTKHFSHIKSNMCLF